jgi:hypothetical protein
MPPKSFAAPPSVRRPPQIQQSATINVVRVHLRAGETYMQSQEYQGQKEVISSRRVTQGRTTLWSYMLAVHTFHHDLIHETECIEIVVIRNAYTPRVQQVWTTSSPILPSYFYDPQWTNAYDIVQIHTGDVIEIRLKPHDTRTPSPELRIHGKASSRHRTPPPPTHKLHPTKDPNLHAPAPAPTLAHFVAMRACLQRIHNNAGSYMHSDAVC